ncbi:hypothetical protein QSI79_24250 [Enterobacter asburiae]|uniref:hypothetical protein n=1 Tax=Enterobacter asburiae TaxID=61645 RepID=UPI0028797422|nr:hypothetical protein [Enterobacter asburiae]MDS1916379.1 hypothetical protein [Enterobacter asburiae]
MINKVVFLGNLFFPLENNLNTELIDLQTQAFSTGLLEHGQDNGVRFCFSFDQLGSWHSYFPGLSAKKAMKHKPSLILKNIHPHMKNALRQVVEKTVSLTLFDDIQAIPEARLKFKIQRLIENIDTHVLLENRIIAPRNAQICDQQAFDKDEENEDLVIKCRGIAASILHELSQSEFSHKTQEIHVYIQHDVARTRRVALNIFIDGFVFAQQFLSASHKVYLHYFIPDQSAAKRTTYHIHAGESHKII